MKDYSIKDIVDNKLLKDLGIHNWSQVKELIKYGVLPAKIKRRPVGRPAWAISEYALSGFRADACRMLGGLKLRKIAKKKRG